MGDNNDSIKESKEKKDKKIKKKTIAMQQYKERQKQ